MFITMIAAAAIVSPSPTAKNLATAYSRLQVSYPSRLFVRATINRAVSEGGPYSFTVPVDRIGGMNFWQSAGPVGLTGSTAQERFKIGWFQVRRTDTVLYGNIIASQWAFVVPPEHFNIVVRRLIGTESPFAMSSSAGTVACGVGLIVVSDVAP